MIEQKKVTFRNVEKVRMIVSGAGQPVHSEEVDHMRKWRPRSYCESEVVFGADLRPDSFMLRQRCEGGGSGFRDIQPFYGNA